MTATLDEPTVLIPRIGAPVRRQTPQLHLRFPAVEGLTGVAALSVAAYHAELFPPGRYAYSALFCLVGFFLTVALYQRLVEHDRVRLANLFWQGTKRLLPALAFIVAPVVVVLLWRQGISGTVTALTDLLVVGRDFSTWYELGDGAPVGPNPSATYALGQLWVLAIVVPFVAVWPVLIAFVHLVTGGVAQVTTVIVLACAATVATLAVFLHTGGAALYVAMTTRAAELVLGAAGAAAAFGLARRRGRRRRARISTLSTVIATTSGVTALAALIACAVLAPQWRISWQKTWWSHPLMFVTIAVATAVLAVAATHQRGALHALLSVGPVAETGRLTYSFLLLHLPIFWLMHKQLPDVSPIALTIVGGGLTWLAALVLHHRLINRTGP
jgi:peptidoglycan/LPS O-acetylase OafA/YrhL